MTNCAAINVLTTEALEVLFRESAAGGRFQISLEGRGSLRSAERNRRFNPPRLEFGSMRDFARVVFGKTALQVVRESHIEAIW
jgi:hypothetical protein